MGSRGGKDKGAVVCVEKKISNENKEMEEKV